MTTIEDILVLRRTYRHPRELIYRAWTEASRLQRWFAPSRDMRVEAEVDLRIGGRYRIAMRAPDRDPVVVGGIYRAIDRPAQLIFTWQWEMLAIEEADTLVTVDFVEVPDGTEVVIRHEGLTTEESVSAHAHGWNAIFDQLSIYMEFDSMQTFNSSDAVSGAALISQAKLLATMSLARLKDTFEHVPDDKLNWRPSDTAKTSLRILAHAAFSNLYFASVLRGEPDNRTMPEIGAWIASSEESITDRAQAQELLTRSSEEVLAAYDQVSPTELSSDPKISFILTLVGRHCDGHAAQIDYLQTCWGDLEDHFGKL